jgi:hypothetical protein
MADSQPMTERLRHALDSIREGDAGEYLGQSLASVSLDDRWDLMGWVYEVIGNTRGADNGERSRLEVIWSRVTASPCLKECFDPYVPEDGCEKEPISFTEFFTFTQALVASYLEPKACGEVEIFRDDTWRIVRLNRPESILRHCPRLRELGCENDPVEALFFAKHRGVWVVERSGQVVMRVRDIDDGTHELDRILWADPAAMAILSETRALQAFPMWLREQVWDRCVELFRGERSEAHDRPDTRELCGGIIREAYLAAVRAGDRMTAYDIAAESRFWQASRDELLAEKAPVLRVWGKVLQLPRELRSPRWVAELNDFARSLRAAADLIESTLSNDD